MNVSANNSRSAWIAILTIMTMFMVACGGQEEKANGSEESIYDVEKPKAVYGKIQHVDISEQIDPKMATVGKEVFEVKCSACHKYEERYVGPSLGKVTERRTPEFVMNMILDTETMIDNDDTVQCLMQEFLMRMPNQSVDEKDARGVLEHLRQYAKENSK